jgi:hypothetical protein
VRRAAVTTRKYPKKRTLLAACGGAFAPGERETIERSFPDGLLFIPFWLAERRVNHAEFSGLAV